MRQLNKVKDVTQQRIKYLVKYYEVMAQLQVSLTSDNANERTHNTAHVIGWAA